MKRRIFLPGLKFVACPGCSAILEYEPFRRAPSVICPSCGAILRISDRFLKAAALASLVISLILAWLLDLKTESGVIWILLFVGCFLVLPHLLDRVMPPLESDKETIAAKPTFWKRNLIFFLSIWGGLAIVMIVSGSIQAWIAIWVGASHRDIVEHFEMWSIPLVWVNRAFIVRPEKSFVAACGIVFANAYFFAIPLMFLVKMVRHIFLRNRVVQLSISHNATDDEEDDM